MNDANDVPDWLVDLKTLMETWEKSLARMEPIVDKMNSRVGTLETQVASLQGIPWYSKEYLEKSLQLVMNLIVSQGALRLKRIQKNTLSPNPYFLKR
jgi:hypothetical protein